MKFLHWFTTMGLWLLLSTSVNAADANITVVRATPALDLEESVPREKPDQQGISEPAMKTVE